MGARHSLLFDVERWRKNRLVVLFLSTVALLAAVFITVLRPVAASDATLYLTVSAMGYAVAFAWWIRQRFTHLTVDADAGDLVLRVLLSTRRLSLTGVRRARVMRLVSIFERPGRRRLLPRWLRRQPEREAVVVRFSGGAEQLETVRRLLGPRYVDDDELIVPVLDPRGLLAEIEAARPGVSPQRAEPGRRGASGRAASGKQRSASRRRRR